MSGLEVEVAAGTVRGTMASEAAAASPCPACVGVPSAPTPLSTHIADPLLRGVSLHSVLRGCGRALASNTGSEADYSQSVGTVELQSFISHEWSGSRWGKTFVLCLIYNSQVAAAASLLVGVALAVLQCKWVRLLQSPKPDHVLAEVDNIRRHYGYWCSLICPLVFAVFFFMWQDMRRIMGLNGIIVFLDKSCIHQGNSAKKEEGIRSIGGFVKHSKKLIVCWTPRYFSRLWCTYEVATWLHLGKSLDDVLFMPLMHAQVIICLFVCVWFQSLWFSVGFLVTTRVVALGLICLLVSIPLSMEMMRESARDLRTLPQQVKQFSIRKAECFCCLNNHELPTTGEAIPCDRRLVYETIAMWFSEQEGISFDSALDCFDQAVRERFGPAVLQRFGYIGLQYRYAVLIGLPYLFRGLDIASAAGFFDTPYLLRIIFGEMAVTAFAITPCIAALIVQMALTLDKVLGPPSSRLRSFATSVLGSAPCILASAAMWVPISLLVHHHGSTRQLIFAAALLVSLTVLLYVPKGMWASWLHGLEKRSPSGISATKGGGADPESGSGRGGDDAERDGTPGNSPTQDSDSCSSYSVYSV